MWQEQCSRNYLQSRVNDFVATLTTCETTGCQFSTLKPRTDGYAQMKLRWYHNEEPKSASPRPWNVQQFLQGIEVPNGYTSSHLCGRGSVGCANFNHIIVEPHSVNLSRQKCSVHFWRPGGFYWVHYCNHTDPPCKRYRLTNGFNSILDEEDYEWVEVDSDDE